MQETLKNLNIVAKRNNAMWDILLGIEETAKGLAESILTINSLRMQIEYMGTRKTTNKLYELLINISDDHLGAYFSQYGFVEDVS